MKLGAEPKKVIALAALLVVAGVVYFINSRDDAPPAASVSRPPAAAPSLTLPPAATRSAEAQPRPAPQRGRARSNDDLRTALRIDKDSAPADLTAADPTLRLDLLAKVQAVKIEGGERNLFQFGAAPAPKVVAPKILPNAPGIKPQEQAKMTPAEPPKPPPPPIPLKFYGYASQNQPGVKRAFFLNGEDIVVAGEGELISGRYKVVRIGINSAVVEDTAVKHQQTLPLEEQNG